MSDGIFNTSIFNDTIFNTHAVVGLTLSGTQSNQLLDRKRPAILVPVEFSFRIKATTYIIEFIEQLNYKKLIPVRISQEKLDQAFSIPLTKLKEVWQKKLKKQSLYYMLSSILLNSDKVNLLRILKELYKR